MIEFFIELSFNATVSFMFLLRLLIVLFNIVALVKIMGFKNLKILKLYINPSMIHSSKIYSWIIAILSFIYIEYILMNSKTISLYYALNEYLLLSLIVFTGLIIVIIYAIIDTINSIFEVRQKKDDIELAILVKKGAKFAQDKLLSTSPKNKFFKFGKELFHSIATKTEKKIDNTVREAISYKINTTLKSIVTNVFVNIVIVSIATYVILHSSLVV